MNQMGSVGIIFWIFLSILFLILAIRIVWMLIPFVIVFLITIAIIKGYQEHTGKKYGNKNPYDDNVVDVDFKVKDHDED